MLAGVCVGLAERGWRVGVTGRRPASVRALGARLDAVRTGAGRGGGDAGGGAGGDAGDGVGGGAGGGLGDGVGGGVGGGAGGGVGAGVAGGAGRGVGVRRWAVRAVDWRHRGALVSAVGGLCAELSDVTSGAASGVPGVAAGAGVGGEPGADSGDRAGGVRSGGVGLLVTWVRGSAVDGDAGAASAVREALGDGVGVRWVRVLGSASADPSRGVIKRPAVAGASWEVAAVVLGFEVEGGVSRWLRDDEIAGGVLGAALGRGEETRVIGRVEPWSARPGG